MTPLEEIAALKARVAELEALLVAPIQMPRSLGLCPAEGQIVGMMLSNKRVSRDMIMTLRYGHLRAPPDEKIIDVLICRIRKKLKPRGIKVYTEHGIGYYMDAESREIIRKHMAVEEIVA